MRHVNKPSSRQGRVSLVIHTLIITKSMYKEAVCYLAVKPEEQRHDQQGENHCKVSLGASVPSSTTAVAEPLGVVYVIPQAVVGALAARRALDKRHLVGGGPLLWPVGAGAVAGALAVVEQVAAVGVLLHAEELVLGVG